MVWWQVILFPFAILYDLITRFRNHLFNIGYTRSFDFQVNVIRVGNLSVGGTGKSPMVCFLIAYLEEKGLSVATLSRGYGRSSKGFRLAQEGDSAGDIGDEPLMFYTRFGKQINVAVGEDRVLAIPQLLHERPDTETILMDDGFQHRKVQSDFEILLSTYEAPFFSDYVLPAGRLREARKGAARADVIIFTKCPKEINEEMKRDYKNLASGYAGSIPVFFTTVEYDDIKAFGKGNTPSKFIIVSGIANNLSFSEHCANTFDILKTFQFPDHHNYTDKDINIIASMLGTQVGLLTTEKDYMKLKEFSELKHFPCFYVPIRTKFLEGEKDFKMLLDRSLSEVDMSSVGGGY